MNKQGREFVQPASIENKCGLKLLTEKIVVERKTIIEAFTGFRLYAGGRDRLWPDSPTSGFSSRGFTKDESDRQEARR